MTAFISLEGGEGVGKTTNLKFIHEFLQAQGRVVRLTREPGGTPLAEEIRQLLLTPRTEPVAEDAELLLMFAARAQHVAQVIKPALVKGETVLCDRFVDASFAYQGGGRGINLQRIAELERWTLGEFRPQLTLLLDLDPQTALARARARSAADRFEQEQLAFFERVRAVYLQRAEAEPERFAIIDAAPPLTEVQAQIAEVLRTRLSVLDMAQ